GSNAFHASSDSQNKLLAMPLPPATQIMAKIYHGINALYGFSTGPGLLSEIFREGPAVLVSRDEAVDIAAFLEPAGQADFAADLLWALAEARRGPRGPSLPAAFPRPAGKSPAALGGTRAAVRIPVCAG
ncbi:MAG: hypothetical protein WBW81_12440, partial [Methylocella sp.]